jgi:hypothetical protein
MKARISLAFSPVSLVGVESSQVNQGVVFFVLMTMEEERDSRRGLTTKIGRKGSKETIRLPETGLSYPKKPIKFGLQSPPHLLTSCQRCRLSPSSGG